MSVRIDYEANLNGPALAIARARPDLAGRIEAIYFRALTRAVTRIQAWWPIKTGRSLLAWGVRKDGPLRFSLINDARGPSGFYAGYVHPAGTDADKVIAKARRPGGVPWEVGRAQVETNREVTLLLQKSPVPQMASVTGVRAGLLRQLRGVIQRAVGTAAKDRAARAAAAAARPGGQQVLL